MYATLTYELPSIEDERPVSKARDIHSVTINIFVMKYKKKETLFINYLCMNQMQDRFDYNVT
jgi:hypothetical protein